MRSPSARRVGVVALVVLSGCTGGLAGCTEVLGSDTAATPVADPAGVTPAPVPDSGESASTRARRPAGAASTDRPAGSTRRVRPATVLPNAPPGIDDRGITDASALLAAHWSVLENRSYTVAVRSVDGSADGVPATYEVAVERPGRYVVRAGANRTPVVYTDATGVFEREFDVADGRVVGVTDDATETGVHFSVSLVPRRAHFVAPAADVERVVRDGAVYYRIHSTDPPETLAAKTGNYSMTAYVRPDGLLRTVALSYDHSRNGTWVRVDRRWTYRAVGSTSVTEPDWVPDENHTWSVRARGFCPRSPKPSS